MHPVVCRLLQLLTGCIGIIWTGLWFDGRSVPENWLCIRRGMARRQMTCGAVSGALMALGLHYGRAADDQYAKTARTYDKSNEFINEFKKLHGSITCRGLLQGLDMNDPTDMAMIRELNLYQTVCTKYVQDSVEIN